MNEPEGKRRSLPVVHKLRGAIRRFKKGKRFFWGSLLAIPVLLLFLALSAEYTSRPKFCTTCHYMEPFYASWKESSHSDVTCVKCHFPPGLAGTVRGKLEGLVQVVNYLGRSYTRRRPWAEIEDSSCLQSGCHETRMLDGTVNFKGVKFNHANHLGNLRRGKKLRCTSCHSQVVQGEHIVVTETTCFLCHLKGNGVVGKDRLTLGPQPETPVIPVNHRQEQQEENIQAATRAGKDVSPTCVTCHRWDEMSPEEMQTFRFDHSDVVKQGISCTRCHNQTVVGDGFVPIDNCSSCHFERERLDKYDDPELLHKVHITQHKIECIQCHLRIQHKVQQLSAEGELECTTCHTSTHKEQVYLFTGEDESGFKSKPNPMYEAGLTCASCHVFHRQLLGEAEVRTASRKSCESCHGEGYARLLGLWKETAETKLKRLTTDLQRVEQSIDTTAPRDSLVKARDNVARAKAAMHLVEVGKAVHNITFADKLIATGYENLNQALGAVGAGYQLSGWQSSSIVPSECANCHTGIEAVTPTYEGRAFSHDRHVVKEDLTCKTCHSNARQHGQLILTDTQCNDCHHDPERQNKECADCHQQEAAIYTGTYRDADTPDYMASEEVECVDCHDEGKDVHRPQLSVCEDCHDEDYPEMATEWKQEVADLMSEIQALIDAAPAARHATAPYRDAAALLEDIRSSAAGGLHNYELTTELLGDARKTLRSEAQAP